MSQTIKLKRSAVAGKVPTTSSLDLGEVAINTNDGKVFFKKDDGTESIQTFVTTDSLTTGSINLTGAVSASFFTGSFTGDGANLDNTRLFISGIDLDSNNVGSTFSKLQFDSNTGLYVSASDADTAFVFLGSHFRDIYVDGSPTLVATGSDQLDVIGGNGIDITTSLTDTNANSVSKELIFAVDNTIATTGSNTFVGDQTVNGNLIIYGTGSFGVIESVTGSAKIIGDAYIVLNNNTPSERYAGIKVFDSGSAGVSASLEFDGQTNDWFYEYSDDGGVTTDHGVVIFGPEYSTKGSPIYLTNNTIQKGTGGHHLADTTITDDGTDVTVGINLVVAGDITGSSNATFSGNVGIGTTSPAHKLDLSDSSTTWAAKILNTNANGQGLLVRSDTTNDDSILGVYGNGSYRMIVKGDGNVGIGTTSPATKLEVNGDIGIGRVAGGYTFREVVGGGERAGIKSSASNDLRFNVAAASEAMRIDVSGNVGIGTNNPGKVLDLQSTNALALRFYSGSVFKAGLESVTTAGQMIGGSAIADFAIRSQANLLLSAGGNTEAMRIDSSGNVGIGTTSPYYQLDNRFNNSDTSFSGGSGGSWGGNGIRVENTNTTAGTMASIQLRVGDADAHIAGIRQGSNDLDIGFFLEGSEKVRIDSSGNVGIGTTTPTRELEVTGTGNVYARITAPTDSDSTALEFVNTGETWTIKNDDTNSDALEFGTSGGTHLTVDTSGNVGIGTTSPSAKLHVDGDAIITGKVTAQEFHTEFVSASIVYQSGSTKFGDTSDDVHSFSGSVAITGSGVSTPTLFISDESNGSATTLSANDRIKLRGDGVISWGTAADAGRLTWGSGTAVVYGLSGKELHLGAGGTTNHLVIDTSGNVGIGAPSPSTKLEVNGTATVTALVETSTRELKENIETLEDQSSIVDSLQPVSYTWKEDGKEDFGLIAEDVEEIAPHLVHRNEDGKPTGIKYSKLSVLLLDVVQKQNTLINDLNERITKLENERGE